MSKARVYEVAKQVGIDNKELVTMLPKLGIEGKNHMGSLSDEEVTIVMKFYKKDKSGETVTPLTPVKPVAPIHKTEKKEEHKIETTTAQTQGQQVQTRTEQTPAQRPQGQQTARPNTGTTNNVNRPASNQQSTNNNYRPNNNQTSNNNGPRPNNNQTSSNNTARPNNNQTSSNNGPRPNNNQNSGNNTARPNSNQTSSNNAGRPNNNQTSSNNSARPYNNQNSSNNTARPNNNQTSSNNGARPYNNNQNSSNNNPRPNNGPTGQTGNNSTNNNAGRPNNNNQSGNRPYNNNNNSNNNNRPNNNTGNNNNRSNNKPGTSTSPNLQRKTRAPKNHGPKPVEEVIEINEEDDILITLPETISVKDLSLKVRKQASDIIKILFMKKIMATANQELPFEMASSIAEELGFLVEKEEEVDVLEAFFTDEPDDEADLQLRPPVVVVMGHVDHGKTSLLDAIRKSKVAEGEQGGITQHIGASVVPMKGQKITFLDTPGHEAFTAMRLRGAMATDIAILVVAADDGVMPQTIEAINHAKAANVKIIVAVNKIDKPGANPDRVKQELTEYGLVAEEWGGDTICVDVSATQGTNLDTLLEMVLLVSEMEEFKANPNRAARGTVIEAELDKGRGPVATVLVQNGTLRIGDSIVAGSAFGKVRAMMDDKGRRVKTAGPSTPVEVLGLSEVPSAGDAFYVAANEKDARTVAERVTERNREKLIGHTPHKVTLDDIFTQIQAGAMKELKIVVKADVQGSLEAVKQSLTKLSNEKVMINVIHGGVGAINESDVMLASASNAIIIGFNVRPEAQAKVAADVEAIDLRLYRVIYNAIEDIEAAMKGMLDPEFVEKVIGHAEVRQIFKVSGVGTIAGGYVKDGKLVRNAKVRLLRDNIVVYEGDLDSLKRFKDDAKEVATGYECGFALSKYNDLKEGDIIEAFIMEEIPR